MIASGALTLENPAYFDRLAEAESSHWWSVGLWALATYWLNQALRGRSGLHALDVGCGAGGTLRRLSARKEISRVVGVDPSPAALRLARAQGKHVLSGDATALPFRDGSFDLVTCLDVWQHLPMGGDLQSAREIRRVLRPGGVVLLRANGRGLWPNPEARPAPYSLSTIVRTLRESGLTPRRATYANGLPAVGQEVLGRLRGASRAKEAHPSGGGLRLRRPSPSRDRLMSGISQTEAFLAGRLGVVLPVGHSTMALAIAR
ncbi:MAG TPA: class I SAM-dependent methyltransferase [Isosphaeraceae bacterium]|nr:class I SAM-dependent methyltransferase [Isosphaeraceae bacterium]